MPPKKQPDPEQPATPVLSMEDLLVAMSKQTFPEGAMCTGWVIVSEWMDADGQFWTYVGADDRNPPWRHLGLLTWAMDSESYSAHEYADNDDDDG